MQWFHGGLTHQQVTQPRQLARNVDTQPEPFALISGFHDVSLADKQGWPNAIYRMRSRVFSAWIPGNAQSSWTWYAGSVPRNDRWNAVPVTAAIQRPKYPQSTRQGQWMGAHAGWYEKGIALQKGLQATFNSLYGAGTIRSQ